MKQALSSRVLDFAPKGKRGQENYKKKRCLVPLPNEGGVGVMWEGRKEMIPSRKRAS